MFQPSIRTRSQTTKLNHLLGYMQYLQKRHEPIRIAIARFLVDDGPRQDQSPLGVRSALVLAQKKLLGHPEKGPCRQGAQGRMPDGRHLLGAHRTGKHGDEGERGG